ncbi:MetQ/NlpA family ABC transporter substrate-binding protein [Eubacteriales bacterium OttesenSCG-928-M02]|nr:MetQ/NlpA family ABC transporter substrate-binding protein [Eubacteriales bacterium OttesenSCG-928-M02]
MKKGLVLLCSLILCMAFVIGCGQGGNDNPDSTAPQAKKIVVGASASPHAEVLEYIKADLLAQGVDMEIKVYNDYVQPNMALDAKELDANFFQHITYMDDFNKEHKINMVSLVNTHYEPMGIYGGKTKSLEEIKEGAKIAVPNDNTNEARALLLLEANGIIKLREGAGILATKADIVENPKKVEILEIEAAQLPRSLQDVDFAVINGNYALEGGLKITDALAQEKDDSTAAQAYVNCVSVNKGDESREELVKLKDAITSEKVKKFMEDRYQGAVVPMFE